MLGNIFGAFGALGRLLPGYMQGERQAIQDNWQDLENYNNVQKGQIANAFSEATFAPAVQMYGLSLQDALNKTEVGSMQTALQRIMYPYAEQGTASMGPLMSLLMPANYAASLGQVLAPLYGNLGMAMQPGMWPGMQQGMQQGNQLINLPSSQR